MVRLSRLTDYAVVVLSQLPHSGDKVMTTAQIAMRTGVPEPTVGKLLRTLTRSGFVASHRGASGGYALALPPQSISIADVVEALEGPIALTECVDGRSAGCALEGTCPLCGNWDAVNTAIRDTLKRMRLSDMPSARRAPSGSSWPETGNAAGQVT